MRNKRFVALLLLLAGGLFTSGWAAPAKKPAQRRQSASRRPKAKPRVRVTSHSPNVNSKGVSCDEDFNVEAFLRSGVISAAQYAAYHDTKQSGDSPRVAYLAPGEYKNRWVTRTGQVRAYPASGGPFVVKPGQEVRVKVYRERLMLRWPACHNFIGGQIPPIPVVKVPCPPVTQPPKPTPPVVAPPAPELPCKGQICFRKKLTGPPGGTREGHSIRLRRLIPSPREFPELKTNADGIASVPESEALEGTYFYEEVILLNYRGTGNNSGTFIVSKQKPKWEIEICNEYVPPSYGAQVTPAPVPVFVPARVSGYFPGPIGKEIRSQPVAVIGVIRQPITRVNQRVIIRRPPGPPPPGPPSPPPGPVPGGGGKTNDTSGDGNNPSGDGRP